jgi:hypothetical protein
MNSMSIILSNTCTVVVTVLDINDCAPEFVSAAVVVVDAAMPNGSTIHSLATYDADSGGPNTHVEYCLDGADTDGYWLAVEPISGRLILKTDNVHKSSVKALTVCAYDRGVPIQETRQLLQFVTISTNDQPVFEQRTVEVAQTCSLYANKLLNDYR